MGFVKGVLGKIYHFIVNLLGRLLGNAVCDTAGHALLRVSEDEILALLLHDRSLLLGHGAAHQIASTQGIARQLLHDLHNLLLVNDTAIGGFQDLLQLGTVVGDALRVILTLDILGNEVHGARAVQGDTGDDVLHALWFQLLHESLHAAAFQLEHAIGPAGSKRSVDCRIVIIDFIDVNSLSGSLGRHTDRVLDHRQGT